MDFKIGDKVKFIDDQYKEQIQRYGVNSGIISDLNENEIYTITDIEIHSWHTKVYLKDIRGSFNSCLFELA